MPGPLDDLRVIDLSSGPTGGLATMVLADFGADVIKVEPPQGDPLRRLPNSPMWLRGKRSVVLDLTRAEAQPRLHDLARGADVVVASYRPGDAAGLGADHETLRALNPGLVYCSITGWGPQGPYAQFPVHEGVVAAKSGRMQSLRGLTRREGPSYAAVQVATHATSQAAVHGVLAALMARDRLGGGQLIETSLLQGMLPYDMQGLIRQQLAEREPEAFGDDPLSDLNRMPTLNYHPVMTKDGRWIQLGNLLEHLFYSYVVAADLTEFIIGEQYQGQPASWESEVREGARDTMLLRMRERDADDWMQAFMENGNVAAEPYQHTQQALSHPDLLLNGDVVETEHPRLGRVHQLGLVARLTETPGAVGERDPEVGEHTAQVLADPPREPWQANVAAASPPRPPLDGVTVLEFATIIATPLGASLLADLGARVIKVEPIGGDPSRGLGQGRGPTTGLGAAKTNAGKESICIDLKDEEGQQILHKLLAQADVVMHNYRPGVPERLGIGYEQAREHNPQIVWVAANGYGPDGPGARRPCAHPIPGAALGGAIWQAGGGMPPAEAGDVEPMRETARRLMRANEVNPDPNTSMVIATAVTLGLYAARRLGVGQRIYCDMMGANAYANHDDAISYDGKPSRKLLDAQCLGTGALNRLYEARSGWVFLGIVTDEDWAAFCGASSRTDLAADPRFATAEARTQHDDELAEELADLFATLDAADWERQLIPAGVGCVQADADTPGTFWAHDPHARENGFAPEADHARFGTYRRHGPVITLRGTPGLYGRGVLAGEHADALLDELGYDAAEITGLRERNVVGSETP